MTLTLRDELACEFMAAGCAFDYAVDLVGTVKKENVAERMYLRLVNERRKRDAHRYAQLFGGSPYSPDNPPNPPAAESLGKFIEDLKRYQARDEGEK